MPDKLQSLNSLENSVRALLELGEFSAPLELIQRFVERFISEPSATARILSEPVLDELCLQIGEEVLSRMRISSTGPQEPRCVYVATEFYRNGGHTLLAADFVRLRPDVEHVFLLTNLFRHHDLEATKIRLVSLGAKVEVAPDGNRHEKLQWLITRLANLSPQRTYWFHHHQDCVAVAAAQPSLGGEQYFIHHADHQLALGVHASHFLHIDLTSNCYFSCRDSAGVANVRYWPLVADDMGRRDPNLEFLGDGSLRTCSSGSPNKFEGRYVHEYSRLIPDLLLETRGEHIHIGPLSENYLGRIKQRMDELGVAREQFIHIPWVKSVWRSLIEEKVDVYLTSWPIGGAKALVEAMGAGIPVLIHVNAISRFYCNVELAYPSALTWRDPDELLSHVSALDRKTLVQHSKAAREHFEKNHLPERLQELLKGNEQATAEPLPLRPYRPDQFLTTLQDIERREALEAELESQTLQARFLEHQAERLNETVQRLEHSITALQQSSSWRMTKPVRKFSNFLGKFLRQDRRTILLSPLSFIRQLSSSASKTLSHLKAIFIAVVSGAASRQYLRRYPDVAKSNKRPMLHYLLHGRRERRRFFPSQKGAPAIMKEERTDGKEYAPDRETVLVICHEASRTGAPVLGLNIVQELSGRYNVVVLLLAGGALSSVFSLPATAVVTIIDPASTTGVISRLCDEFSFKYALVNSIVSGVTLQELSLLSVPTLTLVHEFASNTRPGESFLNAFFWSTGVVFSAPITRDNARDENPGLNVEQALVLPQGRCLFPIHNTDATGLGIERERIRNQVRPKSSAPDLFVVLGAGYVHMRKGVDLFIECAAKVAREIGMDRCRFVWVGNGYAPDKDVQYSVYLADQIRRSGLEQHVVFVDETITIEAAYEEADLLLLPSRLDPLPNVAIDAMACGLPVLCFNHATGIAQFLIENGLKDECVADYLDAAGMAERVVAMASSQALTLSVGGRCRDRAENAFDMHKYIERLDGAADSVVSVNQQELLDVRQILDSGAFREDFFASSRLAGNVKRPVVELVRTFVRSWASGLDRCKPFPGFHPGVYAEQHGVSEPAVDAFADYLRNERPIGPWNYPVIVPGGRVPESGPVEHRVALHLHVHRPDVLSQMLHRLSCNEVRPDLLVTADSDEFLPALRAELEGYQGTVIDARGLTSMSVNALDGFFRFLGRELARDHEIIGHVRTSRSPTPGIDARSQSESHFQHDNLIGGTSGPMLDSIVQAMGSNDLLGLVFADEATISRWSGCRAEAQLIATHLGLATLPDEFNSPVGGMFWARVSAVDSVFELFEEEVERPEGLSDDTASLDPVVLKLLPFIAVRKGYQYAATSVSDLDR